MQNSEIQWTDHTWNFARGCSKVDKDCLFCYMMRDGDRWGYDGKVVQRTKTTFKFPLRIPEGPSKVWPGAQLVFSPSLSDFLHKDIDPFREEVIAIMEQRPDLIFQILTKRTERQSVLPEDFRNRVPNVWMGASIGSQASIHRANELVRGAKARINFLSLEPLWGEVDLYKANWSVPAAYDDRGNGIEWIDPGPKFIGVSWVIVGGESGNDRGPWRYRPCKLEWIEKIVEQCQESGIPVFVKQLGTHLAKELKLSDRHGDKIEEWPKHLQVRQFPKV